MVTDKQLMSAVLHLWASQPETKALGTRIPKLRTLQRELADNEKRLRRLRQEILDEQYAAHLGGIQGMNSETIATEHTSKSTTLFTPPDLENVEFMDDRHRISGRTCTWCQVSDGQKIQERSIDWAMGLRQLNKATVQ